MGKYNKGILGAFSGKVGTVIGSSWNGIDYMRSLPRPSSKAPSDAQLIHRAKFGLVNGFLGPVSSLVNLGYKSLAVKKTGYNVAIAEMMSDAIAGIYPDFEIDYTKIFFSKGSLTGVYGVLAASNTAGEIDVSWMNNSDSGTAKATDKAVVLVYNATKSAFVYNLENGAARSAAGDTIIVPAEYSGDTVQVWIAFMTPDRKTFSTSIHAGEIVVE
ncbi:MAG: DUF6266 family protein [Bacteroidota bacterium]